MELGQRGQRTLPLNIIVELKFQAGLFIYPDSDPDIMKS